MKVFGVSQPQILQGILEPTPHPQSPKQTYKVDTPFQAASRPGGIKRTKLPPCSHCKAYGHSTERCWKRRRIVTYLIYHRGLARPSAESYP
jgi:hypothetical protein